MNKGIAIYGKGGVGKSIIADHTASVIRERYGNTALIGCSPKADSTHLLLGQYCLPTILDQIKAGRTGKMDIQKCVHKDPRGIFCLETGGPEPARGCAGRGMALALNMLYRHNILSDLSVVNQVYDVISDVVCGGFTEPMRKGYVSEVYLVTTAEVMSLYAVNNICSALYQMKKQGLDIRVGGLIQNCRNIEHETEIVDLFARKIRIPICGVIPFDEKIHACELKNRLIFEEYPDSQTGMAFCALADKIMEGGDCDILPIPSRESIPVIAGITKLRNEEKTVPGEYHFPERKRNSDEVPEIRRIAIYGKGGSGKSTVASNLSASLAMSGETVMQIGCDPKHDSTVMLTGKMIPTVLDEHDFSSTDFEKMIYPGFGNVACIESGGPPAGVGCAGQGVSRVLEMLTESRVMEKYGITFSIFDVLGDVVCGGFAQPLYSGICREIYLVINGEPLTLLAVNNILKAIRNIRGSGIDISVSGLIHNMKMVDREIEIVDAYAERVKVPVAGRIPYSGLLREAEGRCKTVIEYAPASEISSEFMKLGRTLLENRKSFVPEPMSGMDEILDFLKKFS